MLERFKHFIKKNELFSKENKLLLAISGGKDSVCLFHLLIQAEQYFEIAHCNFQLRGEDSSDDESFVIQLAKKYSIICHTTRFDTKVSSDSLGLSIQETARVLRYNWFEKIRNERKLDFILTAHHISDHIETMLINLNRSTGVSGLSGIPLSTNTIKRPLMFANSEDIESYLSSNQMDFRHDISNDDDKYLRNQLRHHVIPEWKKINPQMEEALLKSSHFIHEFESMAMHLMDEKWKANSTFKNDEINTQFKNIINTNYAALFCFLKFRTFGFTFQQCKDIVYVSLKNELTEFHSITHTISIERGYWSLFPIRKHLDIIITINFENKNIDFIDKTCVLTCVNSNEIDNLKSNNSLFIDASKCNFPLKLRNWKPGDKIQGLGMIGYKNISDLLTDIKIPHKDRKKCLVLESSDNQIVGLLPNRISEAFKVDDNTISILKCTVIEH